MRLLDHRIKAKLGSSNKSKVEVHLFLFTKFTENTFIRGRIAKDAFLWKPNICFENIYFRYSRFIEEIIFIFERIFLFDFLANSHF